MQLQRFKILSILLIVLTALSVIHAQDDYDSLFEEFESSESTTEGDSSSYSSDSDYILEPEFELMLMGDHSFEFHLPLIGDHMDFYGYKKAPKFKNELGIEFQYKILKLVSHWQLDLKLNEFGSVYDVLNVMPLENYISVDPWKFRIGAGYQYYTWGSADGINPTDNLNPRDLRLGMDAEKLALLSLNVEFFPVDFMAVQFVYVPFKQANKLPIDVADAMSAFPTDLFYERTDASFDPTLQGYAGIDHGRNIDIHNIDFNPAYFVMGGKVSFFFRYADFSVSYLADIDSGYTPEIDLALDTFTYSGGPYDGFTGQATRIKSIDLVQKRLHRFGLDFKSNIDIFGIWAEVCYTMTEDYLMNSYAIKNHSLDWVVGFDFSYGPNSDFSMLFQYIGTFVPGYDYNYLADYEDGMPDQSKFNDEDYMEEYYNRTFTSLLSGQRQALSQGLMINMMWPINTNMVTPEFTIAYMFPLLYTPQAFSDEYEIRAGSLVLVPKIDIQPFDSFHIIIGADLSFAWHKMPGKEWGIDHQDNLGHFYNENNIYVEIKYKWDFTWQK